MSLSPFLAVDLERRYADWPGQLPGVLFEQQAEQPQQEGAEHCPAQRPQVQRWPRRVKGGAPKGLRPVLYGGENRDVLVGVRLLCQHGLQGGLIRLRARDLGPVRGELHVECVLGGDPPAIVRDRPDTAIWAFPRLRRIDSADSLIQRRKAGRCRQRGFRCLQRVHRVGKTAGHGERVLSGVLVRD